MYFLEGSHLAYPELNNCCVKEDKIIISGQILCRIFIQYINILFNTYLIEILIF